MFDPRSAGAFRGGATLARRRRSVERRGGARKSLAGPRRRGTNLPDLPPSRRDQPDKPRSTIARRVLASFAITVVAFAVTLGWGIVAQRRAADDSLELARGYVPVAMRLAQLRAAQTTLSTLVDGIPDEREPGSTRALLETLVGARRTMFVETRGAMTQTLRDVGSDSTRALARHLSADLDAVEQLLDGDPALFERLYGAIASGDRDGIN